MRLDAKEAKGIVRQKAGSNIDVTLEKLEESGVFNMIQAFAEKQLTMMHIPLQFENLPTRDLCDAFQFLGYRCTVQHTFISIDWDAA